MRPAVQPGGEVRPAVLPGGEVRPAVLPGGEVRCLGENKMAVMRCTESAW